MFINYSDGEVKLLDYRLPNTIVCDVQDILHAISIDSEEALCATVEDIEGLKDCLCDGKTLLLMGITDQEAIETLYNILEGKQWTYATI